MRSSSTHIVKSTSASGKYIGGLGNGSMIQLSVQTFVVLPSPSFITMPCAIRSLPWSILLQAKEGLVPRPQSMNEPFLQYLLLSTCETREFGCCRILHACLASNDWLKPLMSWNPSPPSSFLLQSLCQATHDIFLLLDPLLHQNSTMALVSLSQRSFGSLKADMV